MKGHKVIFVSEDEIEDYDNFICPNCDKKLVSKDYKLNIISLSIMILLFILGFVIGGSIFL